jgi:hypothetical protein
VSLEFSFSFKFNNKISSKVSKVSQNSDKGNASFEKIQLKFIIKQKCQPVGPLNRGTRAECGSELKCVQKACLRTQKNEKTERNYAKYVFGVKNSYRFIFICSFINDKVYEIKGHLTKGLKKHVCPDFT